jgi:hypothetical protein
MSAQADTWVRHTLNYLGASDEALAALFLQTMERAGYPGVSAADALEAICADFLAGPSLRSEEATHHD